MNLILLTIDCLKADRLSCLGYSEVATPNLDRLAGGGTLFTQAISVGSGTPTAFTAMFTSTYPLMYGGQLYMTDSRNTVAQVLKEHGYHTAAFHFTPWLSSYYGYDRGFGTFDDGIGKTHRKRLLTEAKELAKRTLGTNIRLYQSLSQIYSALLGIGLKSEVLNKKAASWLRSNPDNFFLWIHYMDAHEPYLTSSGFVSLRKSLHILRLHRKAVHSPGSLSPREVGKLVALYDARISHADEIIGSLLRTLESSNILENTFLIVTADHGQQFGEHGYYGHGKHVYDELIRVPLIIAGPGLESQVIGQQVSLLDLAPTILDVLSIEKPGAFLGNSLVPLISGEHVGNGNSEAISEAQAFGRPLRSGGVAKPRLDANYRRISLRTGKWKYIYTEGEQDELYHLEVDPKETQNVIDVEPRTATELRARIMAHIEFEEKSAPSKEELIKARIRKLKASRKL